MSMSKETLEQFKNYLKTKKALSRKFNSTEKDIQSIIDTITSIALNENGNVTEEDLVKAAKSKYSNIHGIFDLTKSDSDLIKDAGEFLDSIDIVFSSYNKMFKIRKL